MYKTNTIIEKTELFLGWGPQDPTFYLATHIIYCAN